MPKKDYYKILGVDEMAESGEIKKAYRNLALKYHPDRNFDHKKEAEERFKEISEAYYVLSDPARRQEYDDLRNAPQGLRGDFARDRGFNFEEILKSFRGFGGSGDAFADMFGNLSGDTGDDAVWYFASGPEGRSRTAQKISVSPDTQASIAIPAHLALSGGSVTFKYKGGKEITFKVPPHTKDGQKFKLARAGAVCPACNHPVDLILKVKLAR